MGKSGQFTQEKSSAALQGTGFDKFRAVMSKINTVINLIGVWLFRLRKFVMAAPVVYAAIRLAAYNAKNLPEQVGLNLQSTGEFAMTISRYLAVVGPLGADGSVPAADVLFPQGHVSLGNQHFHPGAAAAAAHQQRVSLLTASSRNLLRVFKVSSPIAAGDVLYCKYRSGSSEESRCRGNIRG